MGFNIGGAIGGALGGIPGLLIGSSAGKSSGIQDALFGKKQGASKADPIAQDVRRVQLQALNTQEQGLGEMNKALAYDPSKRAAFDIARQKTLATSGLQDQRRELQAQIARRGLGNSSIGLNAALGLQKQTGDQVRQIEASRPQLQQQLAEQRANKFLQAGGNVMASQNAPIQFRDVEGKRGGGISGLLGAAAGGLMTGSPQGAMAGYNIGTGMGSFAG